MGAQTALGEAMDRNAADKLSQASGNEVHHYCMPAILNPSESFLLDPAYKISIQINGAFFFSLSLSLSLAVRWVQMDLTLLSLSINVFEFSLFK